MQLIFIINFHSVSTVGTMIASTSVVLLPLRPSEKDILIQLRSAFNTSTLLLIDLLSGTDNLHIVVVLDPVGRFRVDLTLEKTQFKHFKKL